MEVTDNKKTLVNALAEIEQLSKQLAESKNEFIAALANIQNITRERDEFAAIIKKAQEQEPVAVLSPNGNVMTKEKCNDDEAFAICCKIQTPLYAHTPIPEGHSDGGKPSLAQQLEFVAAERDGIRKHRDQLLERLGKSPHWIEIENPEDAPAGDTLVLWDGCDLSVDFTDTEVDYGTTFFSNGTKATHYLANLTLPPQSEVKPSC